MSVDGGREAVWAPSGRELFYRGAGMFMSARLADGARLEIARRDSLFRDIYLTGWTNYDVFPDGKEFVMLRNANAAQAAQQRAIPLIVVVNWTALSKTQASGPGQ